LVGNVGCASGALPAGDVGEEPLGPAVRMGTLGAAGAPKPVFGMGGLVTGTGGIAVPMLVLGDRKRAGKETVTALPLAIAARVCESMLNVGHACRAFVVIGAGNIGTSSLVPTAVAGATPLGVGFIVRPSLSPVFVSQLIATASISSQHRRTKMEPAARLATNGRCAGRDSTT